MPSPSEIPSSTTSPRTLLWASVSHQLLHHALPDSRFHYDFLHYTPDFRGSEEASARIASLPCYTAAKTLLVSSDASLESLRRRALHDGKTLLVGTYRLRRGFVLLDPRRIGTGEAELRLAACLDGMEKRGVGRRVELAQLSEEGLSVDLCVLGALVFNARGVVVWEGAALFEVQWAMLRDIGVLRRHVPVVGVAHECQVVDEAACGVSRVEAVQDGEVQCDFVVTNERTVVVEGAVKPAARRVDFGKIDPEALINIPPLQELKGMRMMEQIMAGSGFGAKGQDKNGAEGGDEEEDDARKPPSAEEQMGIDIVERLMRGLKS